MIIAILAVIGFVALGAIVFYKGTHGL